MPASDPNRSDTASDRTPKDTERRSSRIPGQSPPPTPPSPPPHRIVWYWLLFAALMAWNFWAFLPRPNAAVALPYGEFIGELSRGNVASVRIVGEAISGTLQTPIQWPPAAAAPGATGAKPSASGSSASSGAAEPGNAATGAASNASHTPAVELAPRAPPATYSRFRTTYPSVVGDPSLMPLLRARNVSIDVASASPSWFVILLTNGLPILLTVALIVWMGRQASRSQSGLFGFGRNRARRYSPDLPRVTFADVAGADEAKQDLTEVVDFLSHPDKYLQIGARIPRGVLLVGPPGTGKTLLARAVAGEAGVPFFSISGSEFVEMFVGVGASRVRDLFAQAKAAQPAIVFVDELDAVGRRRGAGLGAVNDEREQTLNQLLVEMDGFDERQQVILLAATNRPDVLDPALLRPGRFDREVVVPLPDARGRQGILRIHARKLRLAADVDLERIARTTIGLSGADLANLCNEAALGAARHGRVEVTNQDFEEAWDKIVLGAERSTVLSPRDRQVVAYHEGGHAVVAWLTPAADPVRKVTIVPRGRALGVTEQLPGEDRYNMSRTELIARLDVMLGGRESEQLVFQEITTGAESDLVQATRLARRMITRWAMGHLGPVAFDTEDEQPFLGYQISQGRDYSEATAARIDREVEELLLERQKAVRALLSSARDRLDALAARLIKDETIGDMELVRILGPRPSAEPSIVPVKEARAGTA